MTNWYLIFAYALGISFGVSLVVTELVRRQAIRWGVYDHPGDRKLQSAPVPLLGGMAIVVTFYGVMAVNLLMLIPARTAGIEWIELHVFSFLGEGSDVPLKLTGAVAGGGFIFLLGLWDDLRALGPEKKLAGQIIAAAIPVACGIRVDVIVGHPWLAGALTVFFIVAMANSMNFLDNMDGLCAGVSVISGFALFLYVFPDQTFVCVLLMVFVGSVAGFLYHNMNPARIFMGDAGSQFCGYMLSIIVVLATFAIGRSPEKLAVAIGAPMLALSVPIFDTCSVILIRMRQGESIMRGDKRHFSHRLVRMGMTQRQAVEFIYLVALINGLGAVLLKQVDYFGKAIILGQAVGVFLLIVLLMKTRLKDNHTD